MEQHTLHKLGIDIGAVKYRSILLAQTSICCVVINRCSTRYSSIFRLAYEDLFFVIYYDI